MAEHIHRHNRVLTSLRDLTVKTTSVQPATLHSSLEVWGWAFPTTSQYDTYCNILSMMQYVS